MLAPIQDHSNAPTCELDAVDDGVAGDVSIIARDTQGVSHHPECPAAASPERIAMHAHCIIQLVALAVTFGALPPTTARGDTVPPTDAQTDGFQVIQARGGLPNVFAK